MKIFSLVKAGVVVNTIVADDAFIAEHGAELADGGEWVYVSAEALKGEQRPGPGDELRDRGEKFVAPVKDAPAGDAIA